MKHKKSSLANFRDFCSKEWKPISYVFLGIGLVLFFLNITALLTAVLSFEGFTYDFVNFNLSVFTSMLLIVYIVYTLHEKNK